MNWRSYVGRQARFRTYPWIIGRIILGPSGVVVFKYTSGTSTVSVSMVHYGKHIELM